MAKLKEEQWSEIHALWTSGTSSALLGKTYSVARQVIDRRAAARGWNRDFADDVALATQRKVRGASADATPEEREAAVEHLSDDRAHLIRTHRDAWHTVYSLELAAMMVLRGEETPYTRDFIKQPKGAKDENGKLIEGEPILKGGKIQWFHPVLDVDKRLAIAAKLMNLFRNRADALNAVQEGQRRAHGFDYKMQMEGEKADAQQVRRNNEMIDAILGFVHKAKMSHIATNENAAKIIDLDEEGNDDV